MVRAMGWRWSTLAAEVAVGARVRAASRLRVVHIEFIYCPDALTAKLVLAACLVGDQQNCAPAARRAVAGCINCRRGIRTAHAAVVDCGRTRDAALTIGT